MSIRIVVADPAVRVRDNAPGHGLGAVREQVPTVAGHLRTGPAAGGGFLVEARLPVRGEATA
ncbi:hypothetical protein [Streptomyces sp. NPDC057616]|uniref:hypothetical protein n=1 Tax=Streptomyces sp. NPDC057616 TaxID=3346183 RepID=UPI0036C65359